MAKVIFPAGTPQSVKDGFANFFREIFRNMTPEEIAQFEREWDDAEMNNPLLINHPEAFRDPKILDKLLNPVVHYINESKKHQRRSKNKKIGVKRRTRPSRPTRNKRIRKRETDGLSEDLKKIAYKKIVIDGKEWYLLDIERDKSNAIITRDNWKQFAREGGYSYNVLKIEELNDMSGSWGVIIR